MKTFLILALLSSNTYAFTVSGKQASDLREALIKAGAVSKVFTDASIVKVSNIDCYQSGGFVLLPMNCQFIEDGRLVEVGYGVKSAILSTSLEKAGIKAVISRMAEKYSNRIKGKSVECSSLAIPKTFSCDINN